MNTKIKNYLIKSFLLVVFSVGLLIFDGKNFVASANCMCFNGNQLLGWNNSISNDDTTEGNTCLNYCKSNHKLANGYGIDAPTYRVQIVASGETLIPDKPSGYWTSTRKCVIGTGDCFFLNIVSTSSGGATVFFCEDKAGCENPKIGDNNGDGRITAADAETSPSPSPSPLPSPSPSSSSTDSSGTSFTNPLKFSTVEGFLGGIMSAIQKIIVVLALVSIMIGSTLMLASAGNSGMVEKGKEAITMALVGLAIGVAAPSLLKELANIIGWGSNCGAIADAGAKAACLAAEQAIGGALTLSEIGLRLINFLLGTMGILAVIMTVVGGIMYLTSAGDEDRIEKGKEIFKWSVLGVLLAMASMVLVKQIALFFVVTA
ncbi:MAG: hypothetical protein ACD_67C00055G0005 [uncultured bacterium]|nr:MAG: hypothetical protein ACD_67C00055G0005 [uncultured bacterium]